MNKSQYTTVTAKEAKARTHEATVANIFAAKERHDRMIEEAMARTARENPECVGDILWI